MFSRCWAHGLVRIRHKNHLVKVKKIGKLRLKVPGFVAADMSGNCPEVFLKISLISVLVLQKC